MKKLPFSFKAILGAMLLLALFITGFKSTDNQANTPTISSSSSSDVCDPARSIRVSGSALINVIPDRALIQLGVQSNGKTVKAVQQANSLAIQNVIVALKKQGIEAKDITTDVYNISPIYEDYDALYIKGYRIYNTVAVTVREVSKTSEIVATALSAGANQVNDVQFYTTELRTYRDQARELAVTAAKEKAQALATAAGTNTGCVLSISENTWSYYNGWEYGMGSSANLWTQNTVQNAAPSSQTSSSNGEEPISLGQISVKAEVEVTYSLD
jgi:uncharacterized protein YggE